MLVPSSSVAKAEFRKPETSRPVQRFYTGKGGGSIARLRDQCGLPSLPVAHSHALVEKEGLDFFCDGCGRNGFEVEGEHRSTYPVNGVFGVFAFDFFF